jgi:hypothetical protein
MDIRSEQIDAMKAARVAGFEEATVAQLKRSYPEIVGKIDTLFLQTFVRATILQAKSYQIADEQTLSQFLDYAFGAYLHLTGTDLVPWLDRYMSNLEVPAKVRVERLRLAILETLEEQGLK